MSLRLGSPARFLYGAVAYRNLSESEYGSHPNRTINRFMTRFTGAKHSLPSRVSLLPVVPW